MFAMAVHDFLTWIQVEGTSPATVAAYRSDLRQFEATLNQLSITDLQQVDSTAVRKFLVELKARGLSNATLARRIQCLRSFFNYCLDEGYLQASPMRHIKPPKREKRIPRFLHSADLRRIMAAAARQKRFQDYVVIELLSLTGIRRSELLGLNWPDINFEAASLLVHGKGNKERVLPLPPELVRDLWRLLQSRLPLRNQAVFITRQGGPLQRDSLKRLIDRALAASGMTEHVTTHTFRHTFATGLVGQNTDLATVRDLLGHADISTTSLYAHSSSASRRAAVTAFGERMIAAWNGGSTRVAGMELEDSGDNTTSKGGGITDAPSSAGDPPSSQRPQHVPKTSSAACRRPPAKGGAADA